MLPDMDSTFQVFAAHLREVKTDWSYPSHHHPFFEVNLVLEGSQEMIVNGQRYVQNPGDLMLLIPGEEHESRAATTAGMTYYCIHFDVDEPAFRELLCRRQGPLFDAAHELSIAIQPAMNNLIKLTVEETGKNVQSRMLILSALFELFAVLSGTLSSSSANLKSARISPTASDIAAQLEHYTAHMKNRTNEDAGQDTIRKIAAEIGYSTSSVNRMFSRAFGMSPRQYLSTLMLKKSKLLLMDPELTIEDISIQMGYKNISHFSRQFKRWTGESPSDFRHKFHSR